MRTHVSAINIKGERNKATFLRRITCQTPTKTPNKNYPKIMPNQINLTIYLLSLGLTLLVAKEKRNLCFPNNIRTSPTLHRHGQSAKPVQ
jgi:hypothetical protein